MTRVLCGSGLLIALLGLIGASPVFWRVSTQTEFLLGEVDGLSIDADGHLVLGPVTSPVFDTSAPSLWSATRTADGALWIGSGSNGRLYRLDSDGNGRVVFDADELDIYTVVSDGQNGVLAATSPNGRVYRVSATGDTAVILDPDATYIWALTPTSDGGVYVGTGNPARIVEVTPGGESRTVFESDAAHILTLTRTADDTLLAGTESPGQVIRVDPTGRAFVLLDSSHEEIRSLRPQPDGSLLVVAVSGQPAPAAAPSPAVTSNSAPVPTVSVTTSVTALVVSNSSSASRGGTTTSATTGAGQKGAVYRIAADGLWDLIWSSDVDTPFDAVADAEQNVLVGTGPDGKIYRVSTNPAQTILVTRAPAQQVTRFLRAPDGSLRYTTANPGKVVRLGTSVTERGTYMSDVRDATTVARWGMLSWRGSTPGSSRIELASRSGNTAIPNATWSEWSSAYTDDAGSQITSPNGRYLQWRASLFGGDASPVLSSVTAAYLPRNRRPEVTQLTVLSPGTAFQESISSGDPPIAGLDTTRVGETTRPSNTVGRETYRKGIQTFRWQARDADGDRLEYAVAYQRDDERTWQPLRTGLRDTVFAWNTTTMPDGAYRVKVTASDLRANAPGAALVGERQSTVFDIDNAAPRIEIIGEREEAGRHLLSFTVRDDQSPIRRVEVSQGNDEWQLVFPLDGIPDGLTERFETVLDGPLNTPVLIRATDALRNAASARGR